MFNGLPMQPRKDSGDKTMRVTFNNQRKEYAEVGGSWIKDVRRRKLVAGMSIIIKPDPK
jgi:hypothetical protein